IAVIVSATLSLTVWTLRRSIVQLYTSDAGVAAVAVTLIPDLAALYVFDALPTGVGFVLRAHKRPVAPTVVYALALWGVGLVGGYHVAFVGIAGPPWGVTGMWLMQSIGLGLAAVLLLAVYGRLLRREDAPVETEPAQRTTAHRVGPGPDRESVVERRGEE